MVITASGCGVLVRQFDGQFKQLQTSQWLVQGRRSALSDQEQAWAQVAWKYFQSNYNATTGLVNGSENFKATTVWGIADTISATYIAHQMGLLDSKQFDERVSTLLGFLNTMPLFKNRLPNRYYQTENGSMVDSQNRTAEVGWSAIDIGRLLIWLKILQVEYPHFSEYIDKVVLRWNFCDLIDNCGSLFSGSANGDIVTLVQEGRLGYEEYATHGYNLWGFDTTLASSIEPYAKINIFEQEIFYDLRDPREYGTFAPVLTGPYLYSGIEFNWDRPQDKSSLGSQHSNRVIARLARAIYKAQENRYKQDRTLTARTDHQTEKSPHFVFDAIFANGFAWNTMSDTGLHTPQLAMVSTKAVFGMWSLWNTPYTKRLMESVQELHSLERGWFEGRYELTGAYDRTVTASTNALVLESIFYKSTGKIYRHPQSPTYLETMLKDMFKRPNQCFPPERTQCDV